MTIKQYITTIALGTILCIVALGMIVWNTDPYTAPVSVLALFYVTLFFALVGCISIFSTAARGRWSRSGDPLFRHVERGFRDGALLGALGIGLLLLFIQGWFTPLTVAMFLAVMATVIILRVSMGRKPAPMVGMDGE